MTFDADALRDDFRRRVGSFRSSALGADAPGAPPNICRYCGKRRQWAAISQLDGHAQCVVTDDFKRQIGEVLRSSPGMTYGQLATILGVTMGAVRAWAFASGVAGPLNYLGRIKR